MFPQIPTDNLYKFLALSGIAILLLSIYLPLQFVMDIDEQRIMFGSELKRQKIKLDNAPKLIDSIIDDIARDQKIIASYGPTLKEQELAQKRLSDVNQKMKDHDKFMEELQFASIKSNENAMLIANKEEYLTLYSDYARIGIFIGSIAAAAGFLLWYFKIQKFQDLKIKQEVQSKTN